MSIKQIVVPGRKPIIIIREHREEMPEDCFGYYDKVNQEIYIHPDVTGDDFYAVLLHEIMHVVERSLVLAGEISNEDHDHDERHKFITAAADMLTQIYFLNVEN